jgi:hypothetical protein
VTGRKDTCADLDSYPGIQAGAPKTLLDGGGLRDRFQYYGAAAVDRVNVIVFHACRPSRHGLGKRQPAERRDDRSPKMADRLG